MQEKQNRHRQIIEPNRRPKVLLIGNGLNRVYGGASWTELLDEVNRTQYTTKQVKGIPFPLQAVLLSNDHIDVSLKQLQEKLSRCDLHPWLNEQLGALLNMDFDCILTPNFTYEIECAADPDFTRIPSRYRRYLGHTPAVKKAETRFMLHTYYDLPTDQGTVPLYHIHGEARKPDTVILGHYFYGNLLFRYDNYLNGKSTPRDYGMRSYSKGMEVMSWIDYFILGDVYVLGFGFDTSEIDLWWLLCRKKRERSKHGNIFCFEPKNRSGELKTALLRAYNVRCVDLGMSNLKESTEYREFYERAIEEIGWRVQGRPG